MTSAKEPDKMSPQTVERVQALMRVSLALDRLARVMKGEPEPEHGGDGGRATLARRVG